MSPPIQIKVSLFAGVSERARCREIEWPFASAPTTTELLERLAVELPDAAELVRVSRIAVDDAFVENQYVHDQPVADVALIPPVSGG